MVPPHKKRKKKGKESFIPLRPKKLCSECDTCDRKKCKIPVTYARARRHKRGGKKRRRGEGTNAWKQEERGLAKVNKQEKMRGRRAFQLRGIQLDWGSMYREKL